MICEAFEVQENDKRIGTRLSSFKEYLAVDIRKDEEFDVSTTATFMDRVTSMIDDARKKESIPSNFIIRQIQLGWKGHIYILRSLSERCSLLEDKKYATFFKITDVIVELGGPPVITDSTLITTNDLEA